MAFVATDRVKVTSEHSQHRGKLGTVMSVDADGNHVRLDGFPDSKTFLLKDAELQTTTLANPITQ